VPARHGRLPPVQVLPGSEQDRTLAAVTTYNRKPLAASAHRRRSARWLGLLRWPLYATPDRVICIPLRHGPTAGRQPDLPMADVGYGCVLTLFIGSW